jgi:cytochrome c-L
MIIQRSVALAGLCLALGGAVSLPALAASHGGDTSGSDKGAMTAGTASDESAEMNSGGSGDAEATAKAEDVEFEDGKVVFRNSLDNELLEFEYRTDQEITEAVEEFYTTGLNPYSGDEEALEAGQKLYKRLCQSCHLADGAGRIGPSLNDDEWERDRTHTDVGRFEIIYGGGAGAMQAFGRRMDQDEILKVMAYIDTFRGEGS